MNNLNPELIQRFLDFLIPSTLAHESLYSSEIEERIMKKTRRFFEVDHVSLLQALQRLESAGWLKTEQRPANNPKGEQVYSLTDAGQEQVQEGWNRPKAALAQFFDEGKWTGFRPEKARTGSWN